MSPTNSQHEPDARALASRHPGDGAVASPAFTLVELLLVVTIITLLVALLLPAFARVRAEARRVACAANLNQLGVGMLDYHFNEGAFPGAFTHGWSPVSLRGVNEAAAIWPAQIRLYAPSTDLFYCPEAPALSKWIPAFGSSNPAKYGYAAGEKYVPGNHPMGNSYGHNNNGTRTHGQSLTARHGAKFLGLTDDPDLGGGHFFLLRLRGIRNPSDLIAFADSHLDGTWDAFVDYQVPGEDMSDRHTGLSNMLLTDGHVELADKNDYENNYLDRIMDPVKARRWNNDQTFP
jgi:prepilin-type processing-associated H-X9-DG protein